MPKPILLFIALFILATGLFACNNESPVNNTSPVTSGGSSSPTEAYKNLFAAVKKKDIEAIKKQLTQKTIEFGAMAAQRNNTPLEKMYENGFTATTFAETMPEMRDERIKDNMGALEVWNAKSNLWEDLPFINENGGWRLAVGDLFANTWVSPGRGLDSLEKEAANMQKPTTPMTNANMAANKPIEVKKGPQLDANKMK
jgi:hypothetical protein